MDEINTTVVTAGDRAFAWGALLLVASMRMPKFDPYSGN